MSTYTFESLHKTHTLCGKPNIEFRNYFLETSDVEIASRVRRNCGNDIWETTNVPGEVQKESALEPKRRGRPPKIAVTQGARLSSDQEEIKR